MQQVSRTLVSELRFVREDGAKGMLLPKWRRFIFWGAQTCSAYFLASARETLIFLVYKCKFWPDGNATEELMGSPHDRPSSGDY